METRLERVTSSSSEGRNDVIISTRAFFFVFCRLFGRTLPKSRELLIEDAIKSGAPNNVWMAHLTRGTEFFIISGMTFLFLGKKKYER